MRLGAGAPAGQAKVLGIGLSRTGTTSLTRALEILGLRAVHFPRSLREVRRHDAATDTPVADAFERLDRLFPASRFVYTVREQGAWLASCRWEWAKHQEDFDGSRFISSLHDRLYGGRDFEAARFAHAYGRHEERVLRHFEKRPEDLLVLDLCGADAGWGRLCAFLGLPVPDVPFPHLNGVGPVDVLFSRLLAVLPDANEVAAIARESLLPGSYVAWLTEGAARPTRHPGTPLELPAESAVDLALAALCSRLGGVEPAATRTGLSPERLAAARRRAGRRISRARLARSGARLLRALARPLAARRCAGL
jgi:hypothetical protein